MLDLDPYNVLMLERLKKGYQMWRTASHCTVNHCTVPCLPSRRSSSIHIHPLTGTARAHISCLISNPWWPSSVCLSIPNCGSQITASIVVNQESINPLLWNQLSGATASAEWPFYCPQSMYRCPKRHNILAPKQGYLTAFHSVVIFLLYSFFCTWHTVYFNLHTYVFVERKKIVCDIS